MFLKDKKFTIILVLAILAILIFVGYKWYEEKMKLVDSGLADPKFPFHEYTILELMRISPGGDLNDEMRAEFEKQLKNLPTRTTPQETFDIYIQALKDGDIERALSCFIEGENTQDHFRIFLYSDKEDGTITEDIEISENIKSRILWNSEKIEKGSVGKSGVYYKYSCVSSDGECSIGFEKDLYGDWKISDL